MAFASNLLGAMVGGAIEYLALITGYQALLLVVAGLYAACVDAGDPCSGLLADTSLESPAEPATRSPRGPAERVLQPLEASAVRCPCNDFEDPVLSSRSMTSPALDLEPACPGAPSGPTHLHPVSRSDRALSGRAAALRPRSRATPGTQLAAATPWATPFSPARPSIGRGGTRTARTPTSRRSSSAGPTRAAPLAIVPLMHRHEVEPTDAAHPVDDAPRRPDDADARRADREGRLLRGDVPRRLRDGPRRAGRPAGGRRGRRRPSRGARRRRSIRTRRRGTSSTCAGSAAATRPPTRWRPRSGGARSPRAGRSTSSARTSARSSTCRRAPTFDDYLGDARQEGAPRDPAQDPPGRGGRRRRARPIRPTRSPTSRRSSTSTSASGARWACSRRRRAATPHERLFGACSRSSATDGPLRLAFLTVGDRRVAAGIIFRTADRYLYYNAGVDPDARDLSPGVVLVARVRPPGPRRGRRRFDFLRGDESYKYEWGAVDEPIQRILVRRDAARVSGLMGAPPAWDPCVDADRPHASGRPRARSASSRSSRRARTAAPRSTCSG